MPLPGPSKPVSKAVNAQPKPKPVQAPNPNQGRINELNIKIKLEKNQRRSYMVREDKIQKWMDEISRLSVRR
ncbi:hypothetical protein D3C81_2227840 [compost metagenome]